MGVEQLRAADTFANTGKEGYPTRLFNAAGDINRLIHRVRGSHPGARNDLTASRYDPYMRSIKDGERFADVTFDLYTGNGDEMRTERGA